MEILGLIFVRAHREQDFALYVESLKALVPWFFALDHQNYSRWISVHIRDMESLPASIPYKIDVAIIQCYSICGLIHFNLNSALISDTIKNKSLTRS